MADNASNTRFKPEMPAIPGVQASPPASRGGPPRLSPLLMGDYRLSLSPADYVRRNVRITPLPVPHELPLALLESLPTLPILSSDYPHFEGSGDPMGHYDKELASVTPSLGKKHDYSSAKAQSLLGWHPRPLEDSVLDCARSLIAERLI